MGSFLARLPVDRAVPAVDDMSTTDPTTSEQQSHETECRLCGEELLERQQVWHIRSGRCPAVGGGEA